MQWEREIVKSGGSQSAVLHVLHSPPILGGSVLKR